ncbi:MAG: rhodanese-like domain-containing protein [Chthoniobacteraceae bacterium]
MKTRQILPLILAVFTISLKAAAPSIPNPLIDYPGFLRDASEVGRLREAHRITEEDFLRMAAEPGTIVFDARSDSKFAMLHILGATHLALTDATAADLAKVIPDKSTRILIYCNNNFENEQRAFTSKVATTSLNIYTFNTLYGYGYKNVYELGPLLDIKKSKISFEGTLVSGAK